MSIYIIISYTKVHANYKNFIKQKIGCNNTTIPYFASNFFYKYCSFLYCHVSIIPILKPKPHK